MNKLTKKLSIRKRLRDGTGNSPRKNKINEKAPIEEKRHSEDELCWEPQAIWISPVRQLPGPGEDSLLQELLAQLHPSTPESDQSSQSYDASEKHHFEAPGPIPPVYPNIPGPSLTMEPMRPLAGGPTSCRGISDMTLKSSRPTSPQSPSPAKSKPTLLDQNVPEVEHEADVSGLAQDISKCTLNYVRKIPTEPDTHPMLHGQVWRGGAESSQRWRRHQWVVDR